MHDELRRAGLRRMRAWSAVLVVVGALAGAVLAAVGLARFRWSWPLDDIVTGGLRTVLIGAVAGAALVGLFIVGGADRFAALAAWPTVAPAPAPELVLMVEGLAIAHGITPPRVWRLTSGAPNVGCLPGPEGRHVIVSTAAEEGLEPAELEALVAQQLNVLLDDGARRVRRSLVAAGLTIKWIVRFSLLAMLVATIRNVVWTGLTVNLGVWSALGLCGLVVLVQRRLRWAAGIVGDAVALGTTRRTAELVSGLRRLVGYNGEQVPVRRTFGSADPYWLVPVRHHSSVRTMVTNGRARTARSTEQVSDAALLLRAGVLERIGLGHEPATLAGWQRVADTFQRLGRFGGDGTGDGTIDGVVVTPAGAQAGALMPVGGTWGRYRPPGSGQPVGRTPWRPSREALRSYDAAVAQHR